MTRQSVREFLRTDTGAVVLGVTACALCLAMLIGLLWAILPR